MLVASAWIVLTSFLHINALQMFDTSKHTGGVTEVRGVMYCW